MFSPHLGNAVSAAPQLLDRIPTLEDDIGAQDFLHTSFWSASNIVIIALLLIILGIVTYFLYRRFHQVPPTSPPTAESMALAALDQLATYSPSPRELSLQVSLILRKFLTQETAEPTLYETHQEFSSRMNSLSGIPTAFQYDMRNLLDELSELKYAPTQQALQSNPIERARQLIEGIAKEKQRLEDERKALS